MGYHFVLYLVNIKNIEVCFTILLGRGYLVTILYFKWYFTVQKSLKVCFTMLFDKGYIKYNNLSIIYLTIIIIFS